MNLNFIDFSKHYLLKTIVVLLIFLSFLSIPTGFVEISCGQKPTLKINNVFLNRSGYSSLVPENIFLTMDFLLLFLSGFFFVFIMPVLPIIQASLLTSLLIPIFILVGYSDYGPNSIPIEYILLTVFVLYLSNVLINSFIKIHSKRNLIRIFEQYIPSHLVNELSKYPKSLSLEGEAKILTVFFCDLHNFVSISEQLNAKQLHRLLNEYFTVMTEILFKYNGTIDKYIGDAIMAFWNAPINQSKHALLAVEAGLEMQKATKSLAQKFISKGWPGPMLGIGINTGYASVGNVGSKYRTAYTAIGNTVNLASRLESLTRIYRVPIIISKETSQQLNGIICRELDLVRVRGKEKLTHIFQPICHENAVTIELKEKLVLHAKTMELYHAGEKQNAIRLFKELYRMDQRDKYYKVMIKKMNKSKNE